MNWLKRPQALAVTGILLAQIAILYGFARQERPGSRPALAGAPAVLGGWRMVQEGVVEKEVQEVLKADELLTRIYLGPDRGAPANLFVAYFRTQRTGAAPHSPRNCLPGSGWVPSVADRLAIAVPGRAEPIRVNRYLVSKGETRSVVLYWYQSHGRVIAGEFEAKFFLVADAIRYNRTDTALVRVVVPVTGPDVERTTRAAVDFVREMFGPLSPFVGS